MPRKVLKEEYEGQLEPDEVKSNVHIIEDEDEDDSLDYNTGKEFIRESAASPSLPKVGDSKVENQTLNNSDVSDFKNPGLYVVIRYE